jgi:RimJ/RimL family protein N-acetyltransferase
MVLGGQPPGRVGRRRITSGPKSRDFGPFFVGATIAAVELRGEGVVLRSWRLDDAPAVAAACRDPEIPRWIPWVPSPYSDEDARAYVRDCIDAGEDRRPFAIVEPETGQFLGALDMRVNRLQTGHVGYWVVAAARGQGVCTNALRTLARWAIDELGLARLELVTDPDNVASQRVAEKVGFQREGVLRSHLLHRDGRRRDSLMYSLLPGELR